MKKIAFVFAALAAGFGLWSCSVEPMAPVDENDTVTVYFRRHRRWRMFHFDEQQSRGSGVFLRRRHCTRYR